LTDPLKKIDKQCVNVFQLLLSKQTKELQTCLSLSVPRPAN